MASFADDLWKTAGLSVAVRYTEASPVFQVIFQVLHPRPSCGTTSCWSPPHRTASLASELRLVRWLGWLGWLVSGAVWHILTYILLSKVSSRTWFGSIPHRGWNGYHADRGKLKQFQLRRRCQWEPGVLRGDIMGPWETSPLTSFAGSLHGSFHGNLKVQANYIYIYLYYIYIYIIYIYTYNESGEDFPSHLGILNC